jgi:hypothetical protein
MKGQREMTNDEAKAKVHAEAKTLTKNILAMLNNSYLENYEQEINCHMVALIDALIAVLGSISCKGCRQLAREHIEDMLPSALDHAMEQPAGEQQHVH